MQLFTIIATVVILLALVQGFKQLSKRTRFIRTGFWATLEVGKVGEIAVGDRKVVETEAGSVIVANVDGTIYAVNAKCPHLGLPMKKGAIFIENGIPQITCNFHNSKFSLQGGSCKAWCTGVLGLPGTGFLAGISGKFGGSEKSPATVYAVTEVEGKLVLEL